MEKYKLASQIALRFNTSKGSLSVEQLWQLSQTEKATCLKNLKKLLKKTDDDELSFLDNNIVVDATEQLRFDILIHQKDTKFLLNDMCYYLLLCEIQLWLKDVYQFYFTVYPRFNDDNLDEFRCSISKGKNHVKGVTKETYPLALATGILEVLKLINNK